MVSKRQDAWTVEDDLILAEVILRHIREGGTQLSAFEEVAARLGRTPAACGFRWNSTVRKKYESAIQLAKQQRQQKSQERHKQGTGSIVATANDSLKTLDQVIRFLRQYKNEMAELKRSQKQLEDELKDREEEIKRLEKENQEMKNQLSHVETDYQLVNDDYRALVRIMERARKMALSQEKEEEKKPFFQLDEEKHWEKAKK